MTYGSIEIVPTTYWSAIKIPAIGKQLRFFFQGPLGYNVLPQISRPWKEHLPFNFISFYQVIQLIKLWTFRPPIGTLSRISRFKKNRCSSSQLILTFRADLDRFRRLHNGFLSSLNESKKKRPIPHIKPKNKTMQPNCIPSHYYPQKHLHWNCHRQQKEKNQQPKPRKRPVDARDISQRADKYKANNTA